jgi:hypothetical protein
MPIVGMEFSSTIEGEPPAHPVSLPHPLDFLDFDESNNGHCNLAALNRLKTLLQAGFNNLANPDTPLPHSQWLPLVTDLVVTCHNSLKATHGQSITMSQFGTLDPDEHSFVDVLEQALKALYDYFMDYQTNDHVWKHCLRYLEACHIPIDKAHYESVALSCGQDIRAAHHTIVNDRLRLLHKEADDWLESTLATIKSSIIDVITSEMGHVFLETDNPTLSTWVNVTTNNLREHARSMLLDESVQKYVIPWASKRFDTAHASILDANSDFLQEKCVEAEQRPITDANAFYDYTLTSLKTEALKHAKADALSTADAELAQFKHNLCIEVDERK